MLTIKEEETNRHQKREREYRVSSEFYVLRLIETRVSYGIYVYKGNIKNATLINPR